MQETQIDEALELRGKLGGQHKVPRIINEAELFASLKRFAGLKS
jgi:hypothetical protein